ncbi:MAG: type II toxin-antitoxin system RelE/ParE family toxin [Cyanobacteria bacterium P01_E01_bin.42]
MTKDFPKPLIWVGSSKEELLEFPKALIAEIGFILYQVQIEQYDSRIKPLKGFNGVFEIVSNYQTNTYRTIYAVKIDHSVYVLHAFKKKSKKGSKTPKQTIELIENCLKQARKISQELHNENRENENNE